MSLIDDALRRVNDPVVKSVTEHPSKPPAAPAQPGAAPLSAPLPAPTQAHPWPVEAKAPAQPAAAHPSQGIGITIGLLALLLGALWSTVIVTRHTAARRAAAIPAETSVDTSHPSELEGLRLSGLVIEEGGGKSYAAINDAVLAVGDTIEGWTLFELDASTARLRARDGRTITLRVPR